MTTLQLRDERNDASWQVWPDCAPMHAGAVQELGSYLFELADCETANLADLLIDGQPLEALRTSKEKSARWRWQPGFHAGSLQIELRLPGSSPRRFEVITDPDTRKLTRDCFDSMLREIIDDTFALFSLSSFRKGIARGNGGRPPSIARLEFIRSRIDNLENVVGAIARNPRRRLTASEQLVPYHQAKRATGQEILNSFRSGNVLCESEKPGRLPPTLKGFIPAKIRINRKQATTDIPEHRQIGACLRSWADMLGVAAEQLAAKKRDDDPELTTAAAIWSTRCRKLSQRLSVLGADPTFSGDGSRVTPAPSLSAIFRNDRRYRDFYRIWQDLNRGIASVFGDFLDMPLARTWELYELWCFLRLVRAAAALEGKDPDSTKELFSSDGKGNVTIAAKAVTVQIAPGWKLCFQKQFREFWIEPERQGSFSRVMTPDIVALWESTNSEGTATKVIVLDAKYRIDQGLNDAISSIHTYKDALVSEDVGGKICGIVRSAYLLSPYIPAASDISDYKKSAMPGRLFRPDYQTAFRFGAVTLRPGMPLTEIQETLKRIIDDSRGVSGV